MGGGNIEGGSFAQRSALLEDLAAIRTRTVGDYRREVELQRQRARRSPEDGELYRRAVDQLCVDELSLHDVVMIARNYKWPLVQGDSFFRKMVERRRMRQLGPIPERHIGKKANDLLLAENLGVPTPRSLWSGKLADLPGKLKSGTFIKPTQSSGSKGAFYLFPDGGIFSVFSGKQLDSWEDLIDAAREQMKPNDPSEITWECQELVMGPDGRPGRDMKFFVFYGEIGLIQEVSRHPRKEYEFFDEDGTVADCGRDRTYEPPFEDPEDTTTDKGALSAEKLELVRRFSKALPVPFMRIDFLNGQADLQFLEFSSAPGMAHTFNLKYDRKLGRMYNEAMVRLTNDLLDGKDFAAFRAWAER